MREREDWGFVESDEDKPLVFWNVVYASAAGWPWCDLTWYPQHPMSLEEHALLYEELMTPTSADVERPIEMTPVSLPAGEAYRFVIYNEPTDDHTTTYLLEGDGGRSPLALLERGACRRRLAGGGREPGTARGEVARRDHGTIVRPGGARRGEMMRRASLSSLVVSALVLSAVGVAAAQDEELRMGDWPAYFERVEVPEAGIAVSFPPDWEVDIEMEYDLIDPDDPGSGYWSVLFASDGAGSWCGLARYLRKVGPVAGFAEFMADEVSSGSGAQTSVEVTPLELTVGEAYRVDEHDPAVGEYDSTYLFDSDAARYVLTCTAEEREPRDWLDIAEALEWLPADGVIDAPQDRVQPRSDRRGLRPG